MAISNELMLAILAMDAYNRGYNAGIGTEPDGLGLSGSIGSAQIGSNSVILDSTPGQGRDQAASFFAISYSWNGQTVISYRGTDAGLSGPDRAAYPMGLAGVYDTTQGNLALDF